MSKELLNQTGDIMQKVVKEEIEKELIPFRIYPHVSPPGKFIGEYLQPPPSTTLKMPAAFDYTKRTDPDDALRKYYVGPLLMFVHKVGEPKQLRESLEGAGFDEGDIVIPQGFQDTHVLDRKLYATVRFDNVVVIIKRGTEDHKKILEFNKIEI